MTTHYFSYLPNVKVRISTFRKNNVEPYIVAKNIFRRVKLREAIQDDVLGFSQYTVQNNQRPDQVAELFYDDPTLDWVVLTVNNIVNQSHSWPMTNDEFYNYMYDKYDTNIDGIRHYETYEVVDSADTNRVILEGGLIVDENFTFKFYNTTTQSYSDLSNEDVARPVTNLEYENRLNDEKRAIIILRRAYLDKAILDSIRELRYKKSSDYISDNLKKSYNIRLSF